MEKNVKIIAKSLQNHCKIIAKSLLVALLFSFYLSAAAQTCGTPDPSITEMQSLPWYGNNAWLDRYRDSLSQVFSSCQNCRVEGNSENVWYRVPIEFVIPVWQGQNVLERRGINTNKALKTLLFHLNRAMRENNIPIRFYMLCPRFINNETLTTGTLMALDICHPLFFNEHPQALTCYIVNDFQGQVTGIHCRYTNNVVAINIT